MPQSQLDLASDLAAAVRGASQDLPAARSAVQRLRRRALRVGDKRAAQSCLVALRYIAKLSEDSAEEMRLAQRLVTQRGDWLDFYWLANLHHQRGAAEKARVLYQESLRICPADDRELVTAAISTLRA